MEEKVTESNVKSSGLLGEGVAWSSLVGAAGGSLEKQQGVGHKPVSEHGEYCQCWLSVSEERHAVSTALYRPNLGEPLGASCVWPQTTTW